MTYTASYACETEEGDAHPSERGGVMSAPACSRDIMTRRGGAALLRFSHGAKAQEAGRGKEWNASDYILAPTTFLPHATFERKPQRSKKKSVVRDKQGYVGHARMR